MKTIHIFGAILACGIIGAIVPTRTVKTILLVLSAALAGYGLYRVL